MGMLMHNRRNAVAEKVTDEVKPKSVAIPKSEMPVEKVEKTEGEKTKGKTANK